MFQVNKRSHGGVASLIRHVEFLFLFFWGEAFLKSDFSEWNKNKFKQFNSFIRLFSMLFFDEIEIKMCCNSVETKIFFVGTQMNLSNLHITKNNLTC